MCSFQLFDKLHQDFSRRQHNKPNF
uniref:Uncharacterized protein n=1 Tax=Anguilla anguilla TaxID=7936 RepID=A0A0E9TEC3_ANGAN